MIRISIKKGDSLIFPEYIPDGKYPKTRDELAEFSSGPNNEKFIKAKQSLARSGNGDDWTFRALPPNPLVFSRLLDSQ